MQARLEKAISTVGATPPRSLQLAAAGRTDSGVHARGQAVSFALPAPFARGPEALAESLNRLLPPDIRVLRLARARPGFSARFSAVAKEYRYEARRPRGPAAAWGRTVCRAPKTKVDSSPVGDPFSLRHAHHAWRPLALPPMAAAAAALVGVHDFSALSCASSGWTGDRDPTGFVRRCEARGARSRARAGPRPRPLDLT